MDELIARVRCRIADTHLLPYFDESDLQPGSDWEKELRTNAASSSLMPIRTDLYAGREWCQREILIAKQADMPIVTLNAVRRAEERGSFLMDHVPVVGFRDHDDQTRNQSIDEALGLLVDRALRRALWNLHIPHLRSIGVMWAPTEAPEPVTALSWLLDNHDSAQADDHILVMHPDPPLGPSEMEHHRTTVHLGRQRRQRGHRDPSHVRQPRRRRDLMSAAELYPADMLRKVRLGVSVSDSADLERLGLVEMHAQLAIAEIARAVLVSGGSLVYGGRVKPSGFTQFLMHEVRRYGTNPDAFTLCLAAPEHRKLSFC